MGIIQLIKSITFKKIWRFLSPFSESVAADCRLLLTDLEEVGEGKELQIVSCPTGSDPALSLRSTEISSEVVWRLWLVLGGGDTRGKECGDEVDDVFEETPLGNANCGEGEFSTREAVGIIAVDPEI